MSRNVRRRPLAGTAAVVFLLVAHVGCASLSARAPAVSATMAAAAAARGDDPAGLARGRALYVGRCTRCHAAVAVTDRTPQQWREIVPRMAAKARLTAAETADLAAYVAAAGRE